MNALHNGNGNGGARAQRVAGLTGNSPKAVMHLAPEQAAAFIADMAATNRSQSGLLLHAWLYWRKHAGEVDQRSEVRGQKSEETEKV